MKLYRVGIISMTGKKAYLKNLNTEGLSFDIEKAELLNLEGSVKGQNWLTYNYPALQVFAEPVEDEKPNCPACDQGHCREH